MKFNMNDENEQPARRPVKDRTTDTQAERRARSQRRILWAAADLIGRRGTAGTTLADIGLLAGYSRGLPAHLFGSKENLLIEVVDVFNTGALFDLPRTTSELGFSGLKETVLSWFLTAENFPAYARGLHVLFGEVVCGESPFISDQLRTAVKTLLETHHQKILDYLQDGKARGEISSSVDVNLHATLINSAVRGIFLQWMLSPQENDLVFLGRKYIEELEIRLHNN
jgi:AcrR family transcriptional regulator